MIRYYFFLLFSFAFGLFSVHAVAAENTYSLNLCSVVLNPTAVKWYKLVAFENEWTNPKIVKEDTCVEWSLYLLPNEFNIDDIKIGYRDGYIEWRVTLKFNKWYITNPWVIELWDLESTCQSDNELNSCYHPNTSDSWTDWFKIQHDPYKEWSYKIKLYKRVDWIDEDNLWVDKDKAWNSISWKKIPVEDEYDVRDIIPSDEVENISDTGLIVEETGTWIVDTHDIKPDASLFEYYVSKLIESKDTLIVLILWIFLFFLL